MNDTSSSDGQESCSLCEAVARHFSSKASSLSTLSLTLLLTQMYFIQKDGMGVSHTELKETAEDEQN